MTELAVRAYAVGKCYRIYDAPTHRLKQFFWPTLGRWFGNQERDYFRDFWALKDVSFEVGRGETVGLVGRNGSGKSTLLQAICGTLLPTQGEVQVFGRISALLELGSGFNPDFTGRENVFLNAAILGLSREETNARFDAIAAFSEIGDFLDQQVKTYSSGMAVRLAFSVAIHTSPDLLVVDEALAVGDTAFQAKCLRRIRDMQAQGVSIVLVSHSSNTIVEYCDRALFLDKGHLIMDGPCRDVVDAYAESLVEAERLSVAEVPRQTLFASSNSSGLCSNVSISDVCILDEANKRRNVFGFGEVFVVEIRIRFGAGEVPPALGLQIKSADGIALWSANTLNLGVPLEPVRVLSEQVFRWRLRANFSGNRYVLSVGVGFIVSGEYRRCVRLEYAGHIDVLPTQNGGRGWLAPMPEFFVCE